MNDRPNPDQMSADMKAMSPYWEKVRAILGGVESMKDASSEFLPKMDDESVTAYAFRKKMIKFTNVFGDIVENLAQRPFAKEVGLTDDAANKPLTDFVRDVDGCGNSLHVFAGNVFYDAIANGVDWVLVDYSPNAREGMTVAEQIKLGLRPFWAHYGADNVLAVHTAMVNGREEFVHVRLAETEVVRKGFDEVEEKRIRVLNREYLGDGEWGDATWQVWRESTDDTNDDEWEPIDEPKQVAIKVIALVPFITGRRIGKTWKIRPPMRDAADLQIEIFKQESALNYAKTMTAYPMLTANGVAPQVGTDGKPMRVPVGPNRVLYAPPSAAGGGAGSWTFIEPNSRSLEFLASQVDKTIKETRELGRQPLTAQSGNLTVITTAFAAQKGNAAIQAWAINLKDALENALRYTALWMNIKEAKPVVQVDTEFDLTWNDNDTFSHVRELRKDKEISREATLHEAKRRRILDPDYDPDEDLEQMLAEMESDDDSNDGDETGIAADAGTPADAQNGLDSPQQTQEGVNENGNGTQNS